LDFFFELFEKCDKILELVQLIANRVAQNFEIISELFSTSQNSLAFFPLFQKCDKILELVQPIADMVAQNLGIISKTFSASQNSLVFVQ